MASPDTDMLLAVENLGVRFSNAQIAVDSVSFRLEAGTCLAIVGRSGSGKSTLLRALDGLLPPQAAVTGSARYRNSELVGNDERQWRALRGTQIGFISQDPGSSLTPNRSIGALFAETLSAHGCKDRVHAHDLALSALGRLRFEDPDALLKAYPSQLSGGMKQRVAFAFMLLLRPHLILADEPTSSLDSISQTRTVDELRRLRTDHGVSILLVTHNIAVAARVADTIAVMKGGRFVEYGDTGRIMSDPDDPYTRLLMEAADLRSIHRDSKRERLSRPAAPLISLHGVSKRYGSGKHEGVAALDGITLDIPEGESFGIAGESGCGKSTLARLIAGLDTPTEGDILYDGQSLSSMDASSHRSYRKAVQLMFQEPSSAFSMRDSVGSAIEEPLRNYHLCDSGERPGVVADMFRSVLLTADKAKRRPFELSGGELQRATLARCHAARARFIVYDEPTSALDAETQRDILKLIVEQQRIWHITSLLISHDIGLLIALTDRMAIMLKGRIVEIVRSDNLPERARHPYTFCLMGSSDSIAVPTPPPNARQPTELTETDGCTFAPACRNASSICYDSVPLFKWDGNCGIACHHPIEGDEIL